MYVDSVNHCPRQEAQGQGGQGTHWWHRFEGGGQALGTLEWGGVVQARGGQREK